MAGMLLQEAHAAHAFCGAADEHAQAMIGEGARPSLGGCHVLMYIHCIKAACKAGALHWGRH